MRNYWPFGIFLLAMVVVGMIVLTIKVALTNPVELQGVCQQSSQYIDENSNSITQMRNRILNQYSITFEVALQQDLQSFRQIFLQIKDKESGKLETDAKVQFFLTRPNTTREDRILGNAKLVDGLWQSDSFALEKPGRYQTEALVEIGGDSICITREYFVKE